MAKIIPGKIAYEPHPVSPRRKRELNAQGFKIIDARFRPAGVVRADTGSLTREGIAAMGKAEVSKLLKAHGVEFDKRLGVEKLREMLLGAVFVDL